VEDPKNADILYVGTDNGVYVTFDLGGTWHAFAKGLPPVAVHDLRIQTKAKHLLVGTHGRSIYQAEIGPLQELGPTDLTKSLVVLPVDNIKHSEHWGNARGTWSKPSTPGVDVHFFTAVGGTFSVKVQTETGITVSETSVEADKGFNVLSYDVAFTKMGRAAFLKKNKMELEQAKNGKTYLPKGGYILEISGKGTTKSVPFKIE
jgi:hypothetical protein